MSTRLILIPLLATLLSAFPYLNTLAQTDKKRQPFVMDWEKLPSGLVELSFLLEQPAGKDGFIELKDGKFYTPSGRRFRVFK
jgi:hypothetical protein